LPTFYQDPSGAHQDAGVPLSGLSWSDRVFEGEDLANVVFTECVFKRVQINRSNLYRTTFVNCQFDQCVMKDSHVVETRWVQCTGEGLQIQGGKFLETVVSECKFDKVTVEQSGEQLVISNSEIGRLAFNGDGCRQKRLLISECQTDEALAENAVWEGANLVEMDLARWQLTNAQIEQSSMVMTQAAEIDLSSIQLTRCNLYKSDFSGGRLVSAEGCIFAECKLEGTNFRSAQLKGALFSKASANKACFDEANLESAMFPNASLVSASFFGANAPQSVWIEADLTSANFQQVNAWRSSFRNAVIDKINVDQASLVEADLHGVDQNLLNEADLTDARGSVEWRAEIEQQAKDSAS